MVTIRIAFVAVVARVDIIQCYLYIIYEYMHELRFAKEQSKNDVVNKERIVYNNKVRDEKT